MNHAVLREQTKATEGWTSHTRQLSAEVGAYLQGGPVFLLVASLAALDSARGSLEPFSMTCHDTAGCNGGSLQQIPVAAAGCNETRTGQFCTQNSQEIPEPTGAAGAEPLIDCLCTRSYPQPHSCPSITAQRAHSDIWHACGYVGHRKLQQALQLPACISYENPVLPADFPDPSSPVEGADGYFYIFGTNGGIPIRNVQVARAPAGALGSWTLLGYDALPVVHSWSQSHNGFVWAPEVAFINGLYIMYVTLQYTATGVPAIGIATSLTAGGPYVPLDTGSPLVSQYGVLGSIDAFPFQDIDGSRYLYYRAPGPDGIIPSIYVQGLSADGLSVSGVVSNLLSPSQPWESLNYAIGVIEGPAVTRCYGNTAICLLYSGSATQDQQYATGYAVATNPYGPFVKYPGNPILASGGGILGPGGPGFLIPGNGRIYTMYHSWDSLAYTARVLNMVVLDLNAGTPFTDTASTLPISLVNPTWQVPMCQ